MTETIEENSEKLPPKNNHPTFQDFKKKLGKFIEAELQGISKELETKILDLSSQFIILADTAKSQGGFIEDIIQISSCVQLENKEVSLSEMTSAVDKKLAHVLNAMVGLSKETMQVIFHLNTIVDRTKIIYSFMDKIDDISGKTNMLAINAAIEAARSNESGQTFKVIASEINHLSQTTRDLSVAMRKELTEIVEGINESYELMEKYASADMSQYISQRETLGEMMVSLMKRSSQLTNMLIDTKDSSQKVSTEINSMIFSIQFQDRFRQTIENICRILEKISDPLEETTPENPLERMDSLLSSILSDCNLSDLKNKIILEFSQYDFLHNFKNILQDSQKEDKKEKDNIDLF